MANIYSAEKFIALVKENPAIYDPGHADHKDVTLINNLWRSIAEAVGDESLNGQKWKKKWKSMRDYYLRKRREQLSIKSGQAACKQKPYKYQNVLKFLDSYATSNSTQSNFPPVDDLDSGPEDDSGDDATSCVSRSSKVPSQLTADTKAESPVCTLSTYDAPFLNCKLPPKIARQPVSPVDMARTELISDHRKNSENIDDIASKETSAEDLFFQSCALRMKKLPAQMRSYLQLQISQLFFNAENRDIPATPITPLPHALPQQNTSTSTCHQLTVLPYQPGLMTHLETNVAKPSVSNTITGCIQMAPQ